MLTKKFREYLDKQFSSIPDTKEATDLKAEMLDSLISRAMDLKSQNLAEDEIYDRCIESLGDFSASFKALSKNPIDVVRDVRFWRNLLYIASVALFSVIIYVVASFIAGNWGITAVIIFPSMAGIMYVGIMVMALKRNKTLKSHLTTDFIFSSFAVILVLALFLILTFAAKLPASRTWAVFTLIPALVVSSHMLTTKLFRKKRIGAIAWSVFSITLSVGVYLIVATILWQFHPYWVIILLGVAGALFVGIASINRKLEEKKRG